MHDFAFKNGELHCEQVAVRRIADAVGTPFYLYSYKTLKDHFEKIRQAFRSIDPLICFAMKANGSLAVIKSLLDLGAGLDIVSGGELRKAMKVKADPQKIVFASVGKTDEEILLALKKRILLFNVESLPELKRINDLAGQCGMTAAAAVRVNPDVEAPTHDFITTGTLKNKFGIDLTSTRNIFRQAQAYPHVKILGLHIHIGSQIVSSQPFVKAIKRVVDFMQDLQETGVPLKYLDIGGGLGIIYDKEQPQTAAEFSKAVLPYLQKLDCRVIMEPGRFIAGNAGIFVSRVLYLKDNGLRKFLIVDGGMNDLIRPSLYQAYHDIVPVQQSRAKKIKMDVVGPICESGDFFGKDRWLPPLAPGELLAVMSAGAYGQVMSSNYNVRCRVPEVMVKGRQFEVIRKRERYADLFRGESLPTFLQ